MKSGSDVTPLAVEQESSANPFVGLTYVMLVLSMISAAVLVPHGTTAWLAVAALAWGWTEIGGLCGTSHLGAITCLRAQHGGRALWLRSMTAYTFGGCITGAAVGYVVGIVGYVLGVVRHQPAFFSLAALLAVVLAARELRLIRFQLLQVNLQTQARWVYDFGPVMAAAMWGMHIGIGFATVVRYGGFWTLVTVLIGTADPAVGALVMVIYWVGRTLPIWMTPLFVDSSMNPVDLSEAVSLRGGYRHLAAATLLWVAIALLARV